MYLQNFKVLFAEARRCSGSSLKYGWQWSYCFVLFWRTRDVARIWTPSTHSLFFHDISSSNVFNTMDVSDFQALFRNCSNIAGIKFWWITYLCLRFVIYFDFEVRNIELWHHSSSSIEMAKIQLGNVIWNGILIVFLQTAVLCFVR